MRSQEDIDFGIEAYLKELDSKLSYVDVGLLAKDSSQDAGGLSIVQLGTIQEFGIDINVTPKMRGYLGATGLHLKKSTTKISIPPRSFIRQTFDEQLPELQELADRLELETLTKKKTRREALAELGQTHQNRIQTNMADPGKYEPNHPYTLMKKAPKTTPLIGKTARLRQAISHEVG